MLNPTVGIELEDQSAELGNQVQLIVALLYSELSTL
jgi:hypothetical protein